MRKLVTRTQSLVNVQEDCQTEEKMGNVRTVFLFKITCEKFEPQPEPRFHNSKVKTQNTHHNVQTKVKQ